MDFLKALLGTRDYTKVSFEIKAAPGYCYPGDGEEDTLNYIMHQEWIKILDNEWIIPHEGERAFTITNLKVEAK